MVENEHRTALVHGRKGGGVVEGNSVVEVDWGGAAEVDLGDGDGGFSRGVRLVAVYQPVWMTDEVVLERCRREPAEPVEYVYE